MLFIATLTYRRTPEDMEPHLDAHRDWLAANTRAGRIVAAGPLEPRSGGLVIAHCTDRSELDRMLAQDPFVIHRLVDVGVQGFAPALRHEAFAVRWAAEARAVAAA